MNTDGSDRKAIATDCHLRDGVTVDIDADHFYWSNMGIPNLKDGSIEHINRPPHQLIGHFAKGAERMPLYTVTTQDGFLSVRQRDLIAAELVRIHTTVTDVPENVVHSIFTTYAKGRAFVAADRSTVASIVGVIRAGHTSDEKSRLVQALWRMFQDKTGVPDRDLSVALQEVSPTQAMENGMMVPKVGQQ
jgi:phenylpyruvate tautomerase PptA (4-oxalocrotonate tautomerase family)